MAGKIDLSGNTADREVIITRVFDAPRELVFKAWIEPDRIAHWFGPTGFTTTTKKMEVRPGGTWQFIMHGPDGTDWDNFVSYEEVVPPERLVYYQGSTADPYQFHVTVTFAAEGKKTRLTLHSVFPTAAVRDYVVKVHGAIEGGHQTLERLAAYLVTMS